MIPIATEGAELTLRSSLLQFQDRRGSTAALGAALDDGSDGFGKAARGALADDASGAALHTETADGSLRIAGNTEQAEGGL